jgi:hypothetical protein
MTRYGQWALTRYRVADPTWRVGVNRICGYRIGWFVVLGAWCYSLCKPETLESQRRRAADKLRER